MKALLFAGLAAGLAGSSLQAQEQPAALAGTLTQAGQTAPDPSVQQLLQMATEMERQSTTDADAHPPADQTAQTSVVQQIVHLAMLEITQLQQKLKEDDAGDPRVAKESATVPADAPGSAAAAPSLSDAAFSAFAHAWDTSLSTGGLHTGGLQTGGLQTGHLNTGHLTTGSAANATLPSRTFIIETSGLPAAVNTPPVTPPAPPSPPAVVNAPPASAPAAVNTPPADPDNEMLRWSRRIDRQYDSEQAARRAALRLYPALAVAKSAFNTQFLARYSQYRQADPFGFLRGPGWPMKLAIFTAGDLQRQRGGTVF